MTYRYVGHSVQDPQAYRDSAEIDQWRIRDPINTFREASLVNGMINDEDIARIDERVAATVAEAVKFAEESDEPSLESLYDNLYG